jgi:hypothetical protein
VVREVESVSVDVIVFALPLKLSVDGENEAVTPVGSAVVSDRVAEKLPFDPVPVPRFTVITYVHAFPLATFAGVETLTVTDPIRGVAFTAFPITSIARRKKNDLGCV